MRSLLAWRELGQGLRLVVLAVLNSAVAAYYYLRVVIVMYMREPERGVVAPDTSPLLWAGIALALFGTVLLGILPDLLKAQGDQIAALAEQQQTVSETIAPKATPYNFLWGQRPTASKENIVEAPAAGVTEEPTAGEPDPSDWIRQAFPVITPQ